jgi:acetylornithine deacetylase/succinyl-diaminopimelate desuccinylase-like protein
MPSPATHSFRPGTLLRSVRSCIVLTAAIPVWTAPAAAQAAIDMGALQNQAVGWLQEYIRVNTINPPGNEILGARFLAGILEAEGIAYEIIESAPGRGNLVARLPGGDEPALILLHHIDVVPADARYWSADPLSGELRDGYIYGRGALDTKTGGILQLAGFLALHRSGVPLRRDVIYMATADEEAGGFFGAGWLVENRPDLFEGVGFLLNEGGGGDLVEGRVQFGIEVTQKVPYWLRLTAAGEPGHGSRPRASSAVTELIAALERLRVHAFEPRVIPVIDEMFRGMAANAPPPWSERFADMTAAIRDEGVLAELQAFDPGLHGLTRNTCSITRLDGSDKINVVPPEATAEIDCRLLPDQDPDAFLAELADVLGPDIAVETLMGFSPAISPTDNPLYETIATVTRERFPEATVVPAVLGGFTDSHFFRDLGIASYGYEPTVTPAEDQDGVHGNDERVTEENVRRGVEMMVAILNRFAAARSVF